jgi:hypothetical protein
MASLNVPLAEIAKPRPVLHRFTESASRATGKQSSQLLYILQLYSTILTFFWHICETPQQVPNKMIPAACRTIETGVTRVANWPPILEISFNDHDADAASNNSLALDTAECKPPGGLKHPKFSSKQFAKRMGQGNYSAFDKNMKV